MYTWGACTDGGVYWGAETMGGVTAGGVYWGAETMGGVTAGGVNWGAATCGGEYCGAATAGGVTTGGVTIGAGAAAPGAGAAGIGIEEADSIASCSERPDTMRVNSLGPAGATGDGGAAAEGSAVNTRVASVGAAVAGTNGRGVGATAAGGAGTGGGSPTDGAGVDVLAADEAATRAIDGAPKIRVNAPGSRRKGTASKRLSGLLDCIGDSNNLVNPPGSWRGGGGGGVAGTDGASFCADGLKGELKNCVNSPSPAGGSSSPRTNGVAGAGVAAGVGVAGREAEGGSGAGALRGAGELAKILVNSLAGRGDAGALPPAARGSRGARKILVNSPAGRDGGATGGAGSGGRGVSALPASPKIPVTSPGDMDRCGTAAGAAGGADFTSPKMSMISLAGAEATEGAGWAAAGGAWPNMRANCRRVSESSWGEAGVGGPGCLAGRPDNSADLSGGGCSAGEGSSDPKMDVLPFSAAGAGVTPDFRSSSALLRCCISLSRIAVTSPFCGSDVGAGATSGRGSRTACRSLVVEV